MNFIWASYKFHIDKGDFQKLTKEIWYTAFSRDVLDPIEELEER